MVCMCDTTETKSQHSPKIKTYHVTRNKINYFVDRFLQNSTCLKYLVAANKFSVCYKKNDGEFCFL